MEQQVLRSWQESDVFRACIEARATAPVFTFYEGPPTANGTPGIHHVLGRTLKDAVCRHRTMKGFRVDRKAGWDTHGLPVEIEVEKQLGLADRAAIETYGIGAFNRACRQSVLRYKQDWDRLTRRIGYWVDLEAPYITFENRYIESVWWIIRQLHERGLLYKGHKIQWYSPGSGTVLSSHEVSLGYREVEDPGAFVRFALRSQPDVSLLAWTTTPWTLTANAALAVGADIDYVRVRPRTAAAAAGELILAAARLEVLEEDYEVVAQLRGQALLGERYRPLFPPAGEEEASTAACWQVLAGDFVSTEEGTGVVHIAPAFGEDDYAVGREAGLPLLLPVDADGRFTDAAPLVAGQWFKDADKIILRDLRQRGLLHKLEPYRHNYPFDWRRDTPLMSYPVESWFIRTTALRERLVALNDTIHWHPRTIGSGRFGNWLQHNVDWALSRRRYWGTPLPVWVSDAPGSEHFEVIGSIAELRRKCGDTLPADGALDLHRPLVDELSWPAPDGGRMRRVSDVIDVWFDSGAMPFAQWHYPFEHERTFRRSFPADFIAEGIDQTRGWFYTLHVIAAAVMEAPAFRNVVVNGLVLDDKGEKMSKSRGNVVDPFAVVERHGADVVRWYLSSNSAPWEDMRFREQGLVETRRKFFGTLENVYAFLASYANIDGFDAWQPALPPARRSELDRWIGSRVHSTIGEVDAALLRFDTCHAARSMETLVEELSNWYIRRSRPRFWRARHGDGGSDDTDKQAAYQTTAESLFALARMLAPIAPFFGEWLYQRLNEATQCHDEVSVHLAAFPVAEPAAIDAALERSMALARRIVSSALLLRNRCRINVRQPLARLLLALDSGTERSEVERVRDLILEEVNVRTLEYLEHADELLQRSLLPNYPVLGPRLGRRMGALRRALADVDGAGVDHYLAQGWLELEVEGERLRLEQGELEVRAQPLGGWEVAQTGGAVVALDTAINPELLASGLARESIHRIQNMRKARAMQLTDRIHIEYHASAALDQAIQAHAEWIRHETLAMELRRAQPPSGQYTDSFTIDDHHLHVAISRAP